MKIKYQFSLFFLAATSILVFTASAIFYYKTKNMLLEEKYAHLESIAAAKQTAITEIIREKYETAQVLTKVIQTNTIANNSAITPIEEGFITPIKKYRDALRSVQNIYLLDSKGIIVEAFDDSQIGRTYLPKDTSHWLPDYWYPSKKRSPYIEGVHLTIKKSLVITICCPVYIKNIFIGTLVADLDASDILLITGEFSGLGETGETVLAKKNTGINLVTPTRFFKDSILRFPIGMENEKYVLYHVFQKKEGLLLNHLDYRSEEVIASLRYIEQTGWGLITKIDKTEAMFPVYSLKRMLILLNGINLVLLFFAAYAAGTYFATPINRLIQSINKIKEGDLSRRIEVNSKNELGILASSFNDMAERLEKKIQELKLSNDSLNKFAYVITHDLKSPIISISSLASILKEEYSNQKIDTEGIKMLDMMIMKTKHAGELIEGVLSSAKKGFISKEKEWINTTKLLENVIDNLNPPPNIKIDLHPQLPFVSYNKVALIQVFQNLISNAIKFSNKAEGLIEIGGKELEDKIKFCVKDNGPGIKESEYSKIFLMFEAQKGNQSVESHGIGLSIVKKIVTENDGEIWLESKMGKGTTFFFTIPKT